MACTRPSGEGERASTWTGLLPGAGALEAGAPVDGTASPGSPNQAITVPEGTTSPGWHATSSNVPVAAASTSRVVLSDSASNRGSPSTTCIPTGLNHCTSFISSLDWPRAGIRMAWATSSTP